MKKFDDMAARIRNVVLPDPTTSNIKSDTDSDSGKASLLASLWVVRNKTCPYLEPQVKDII